MYEKDYNTKLGILLKDVNKSLDKNFKYFCHLVKKDLRDGYDYVIAITGYPGVGKSQLGAIFDGQIDEAATLNKNICFIPTSKEIEKRYMSLPIYSPFHIDEASRGLHKHKWYDKVQQKLNLLFDTERENHYLCTIVIMPRFQNFTENFRNFRIKYWINILERGLGVVYKRDEDKDAKDPWHIEENYKLKEKKWYGKRIFERSLPDIVRKEQLTKNYWFYFKIPEIPKEIWAVYQELKKKSREFKEPELDIESYRERLDREKIDRWNKIKELKNEGMSHVEIGAVMGISAETIRRHLRQMEAYERMKGKTPIPAAEEVNNIFNQEKHDKVKEVPEEFNNL